MSTLSEDPILFWLKKGELDKLEQAVLDGYGDYLSGKTSRIPQVNRFLKQIPNFTAKIEEIHKAVTLGKLRSVQHLIDRKKLAFCRDQMGATPLHKAVIYGQTEIIQYLLDNFGSVIHSRDHRGRTALHYAAVIPDNGEIFKMLVNAGADEKAADMFGKKPEDYLNNQEGISVQVLRENAIVSKPAGYRRSRRSAKRMIDPQSWTKLQLTKSLMHRSNIKELIKQGNLMAIEEVVLQGFGDRLIGETSTAPLVQEFLDRVPSLIEQITEIHKTAAKGNVAEFKSLIDRKAMVLARDQIGATPLHKSVLYGNQELTDYIANSYPSTLDSRDHEGRTPLHFAAVLQDDRLLFNLLVKAGASPLLPDYKGKSAEYYLRFPDQLSIQQIIKRSQRLNANYAINTANRVKSKSPHRRRGWSPSSRKSDGGNSGARSEAGLSDDLEGGEMDDGSSNGSAGSASNGPFSKASFRSRPANILPPSTTLKSRVEISCFRVISLTINTDECFSLQGFEVTSANLKKWIEEQDLEALEGAILEGHGDRVRTKVEVHENKADTVQNYLDETFPKIMNKIRIIHAAVSCGDVTGLQNHLDKNDYVLAKDHLGMAPLHKAVILGHIDVVDFILEKFPETVNAKDREGRTALHYAAATTNRNGAKIYKILLRAGADPRIRDANNKTAEYYRVHLLPLPSELSKLSINVKRKTNLNGIGLSPITKRKQFLLPSIQEKITTALHDGDSNQLKELVLEGYGDSLIGRTSWGEEARKFLKNLPHLMDNIKVLQTSIVNGDLNNCERVLRMDSSILRAKDENGLLPIHSAVYRNEPDIVEFIMKEFPSTVNMKDHYGRTPLHIAAQNKNTDLYKKIIELGGDAMKLDMKGRTADQYLKGQSSAESHKLTTPSSIREKNDYVNKLTSNEEEISIENYTDHFDNEEKEKSKKQKPHRRLSVVQSVGEFEEKAPDDESPQPTPESEMTKPILEEEFQENSQRSEATEIVQALVEDSVVENSTPKELEQPMIDEILEISNVENEVKEDNEQRNESEEVKEELNDKLEAEVEQTVSKVQDATQESKIIASKDKIVKTTKDAKYSRKKTVPSVRKQMSLNTTTTTTENNSEARKNSLPSMSTTRGVARKNKQLSKQETELTEVIVKPKKTTTSTKTNKAKVNGKVALKRSNTTNVENATIVAERLVNSCSLQDLSETQEIDVKSGLQAEDENQAKFEEPTSDVKEDETNDSIDTKNVSEEANDNFEKASINTVIENITENEETSEVTEDNETNVEAIEEQKTTDESVAEDKEDSKLTDEINHEVSEETQAIDNPRVNSAVNEAQTESKNEDVVQEIDDEVDVGKGADNGKKMEAEQSATLNNSSINNEITDEVNNEIKDEMNNEIKNGIDDEIKNGIDDEIKDEKIDANKKDGENGAEYEEITEKMQVNNAETVVESENSSTNKVEENQNGNETLQVTPANSPIPTVNEDNSQSTDQLVKEENDAQLTEQSSVEIHPTEKSLQENNSEANATEENKTKAEEQEEETTNEVIIEHKSEEKTTETVESVTENTEDSTVNLIEDEKLECKTELKESETELKESETELKESETELKESETEESKQESAPEQETYDGNIEEAKAENNNNSVDDHPVAISTVDMKAAEETRGEKQLSDVRETTESEAKERKQSIRDSQIDVNMINEDIEENNNTEESKADKMNRPKTQTLQSEELKSEQTEELQEQESSTREQSGRQSQEVRSTPMSTDDRLNELIEQWLRDSDLLRLEHVVIAGQGERLIGKTSDNKQVQEFLDLVPAYMAKIRNVHETVVRGNFNEVRQILTRKRFALSRDHYGASPLHLAVLHQHMDVLVYIITQFPETIDGPDNEGRTALHYAAVIDDEDGQYYEILKKAGASDTIVDKMGNTAPFYLQNKDVLTIRDLLENYKQLPGSAKKEPESVDVWRRPPTADIESQLTPSSAGSPVERINSADSTQQKHHGHQKEVSADVHVDADPKEDEENTKAEIESMSSQFEEALKEEKERLQENFDKVMENTTHAPESLNEDVVDSRSIASSDSDYNLCQVKNEKGQTILHLAASKPQKRAVLYKMLSQAEFLIPERDAKYRTIRDVAIDKQLKRNVSTIDEYVLDAFVKGKLDFIQRLSHEAYDLHNVVDVDGNDVTAVLRRKNISSTIDCLQDISEFQKSRGELHTFIKNDYTQGVCELIKKDPSLITAKNTRGRSALHIAVLFTNLEIIKNLIETNPSAVNVQDNLGRTPLHYAMANTKAEEIAKLLIVGGANRLIRDVHMRTPSFYFVYKDEIRDIRREEQAFE